MRFFFKFLREGIVMLEITYIFAELFEPLIMRFLNLGFLDWYDTYVNFLETIYKNNKT